MCIRDREEVEDADEDAVEDCEEEDEESEEEPEPVKPVKRGTDVYKRQSILRKKFLSATEHFTCFNNLIIYLSLIHI